MFLNLLLVLTLFNPSFKTLSGRNVKYFGTGPPLFFSSGLFGTMPKFLYNSFLNNLAKNNTIFYLDDYDPIKVKDINEVIEVIGSNEINYLGHSSFNKNILEIDKLRRIILLDPIIVPTINFNGIESNNIKCKNPVLIIKTEKLYNAEKSLPKWQELIIEGDVEEEIYSNIGHPDILDNFWADFAKSTKLWDMVDDITIDYSDWKIRKKSNKYNLRNDYRNYIVTKCNLFIK